MRSRLDLVRTVFWSMHIDGTHGELAIALKGNCSSTESSVPSSHRFELTVSTSERFSASPPSRKLR